MRGHVRRRGKGWCVVVELPRDPATGKRRQKWHSGFERKRDAERALSNIVGRIDEGSYVPPSRLTLGAFLTDRWLPTMKVRVRPSTYDSYRRIVEGRIVPALGLVPLQHVTGDQLTAVYADWLAHGRRPRGTRDKRAGTGLSPRTVRYAHAIVRLALADAVRWGHLTRNPAEQADPPTAERNRQAMKTWTPGQLGRFLESRRDDRLYALWHLLAMTGERRGEVLGVVWPNVDLQAARLAVRRTALEVGGKLIDGEPKTDKGRRNVALDADTVAVLDAHRKRQLEERLALGPAYQDRGLVFCREDGTPLHPDQVSKAFKRHAKAACLPPIRLHDLRHSHATHCLEAGVHAKVVSERLGHSTVAMTLDTYSHAVPALEEDAAARVAALVLG
jgi:integrase